MKHIKPGHINGIDILARDKKITDPN